jgi:2-phosphosulfolactate phosphatase
MTIVIDSLLGGAERATGATAIIDVFRAFTTTAVMLANGAARVIMVGAIEDALALRARGIARLCVGEAHGLKPDAFDFGNSPFAVSSALVSGETIALRTSAGTRGIVAARHASSLYATALVTASATARACRLDGAETISLIPMGKEGLSRTDEDELCALHMRNILEGRPGDPGAVRGVILACGEVARFNDAAPPHSFPEDLAIALEIDRFDFAVQVRAEDGFLVARKRTVQ